jgi:diacylglycerol kinase (ATP)
MRITLMHNPKAGTAQHGKKQLLAALKKAGHRTIYQSTKKRGWEKALKKPTDLVLSAGGDGTVAKVGRKLIDTGIPLAILPLGTANNLARSLGFKTSIEKIIRALRHRKKRVFDVGVARAPWGRKYFFESVGAGLLADYVHRANRETKKQTKKLSKEQELTRHVSLLCRLLHKYRAKKWKVEIDGQDASIQLVLWEAMNIQSVGPALYLSPRAATKDGFLDFVSVREKERPHLHTYLDEWLAGNRKKFPFRISRCRKVEITSKNSIIRLDGKIWPRDKRKRRRKRPAKIEITIRPSALVVLQPPRR